MFKIQYYEIISYNCQLNFILCLLTKQYDHCSELIRFFFKKKNPKKNKQINPNLIQFNCTQNDLYLTKLNV